MRVAVFTDANLDSMNGATRTLRALMSHAPPDVCPRVFSFAPLDVDAPDYFAAQPTALWVPALRRFRERLRDDNVRVIHATTSGPAGLAASYLACRTGLPIVGSVHTSLRTAGSREGVLKDCYRRWFLRGCDRVLMPRGVDGDVFSPARRSNRLRDDWHVSDRRPAILVVGRLSAEKGVDMIGSLSSWLHERRIAHRFVVAGDGPMRADVMTSCPDAALLGKVPHDDLPAVFASADILLYPTDAHGGCTVLLEAQASGLPVIVSAASNAVEHMVPSTTGYVCRAGDIAEFGTRVGQLLVDHDYRRSMGRAARRFALTRPWSATLEPVYALYRRLAAGRAIVRSPTLSAHHESPRI